MRVTDALLQRIRANGHRVVCRRMEWRTVSRLRSIFCRFYLRQLPHTRHQRSIRWTLLPATPALLRSTSAYATSRRSISFPRGAIGCSRGKHLPLNGAICKAQWIPRQTHSPHPSSTLPAFEISGTCLSSNSQPQHEPPSQKMRYCIEPQMPRGQSPRLDIAIHSHHRLAERNAAQSQADVIIFRRFQEAHEVRNASVNAPHIRHH